MAAPHGRIEPGQPLESAISARAWNRAQDAADIVMGAGAGMGAAPSAGYQPIGNIILARNNTGGAVPRWGVLRIAGIEVNPLTNDPNTDDARRRSFEGMPIVTGAVPDGTTAEKFVIAIEPIAPNKIGRVCAAGITQAKVEFVDITHTRAKPKADDTSLLVSSDGGPAAIVWASGNSGPHWALIRLNDNITPLRVGKYKGTPVWTKHTTGIVEIWEAGTPPNETATYGSQGAGTKEIVGVVNHWGDVDPGSWVGIQAAANGHYYLVVAEC